MGPNATGSVLGSPGLIPCGLFQLLSEEVDLLEKQAFSLRRTVGLLGLIYLKQIFSLRLWSFFVGVIVGVVSLLQRWNLGCELGRQVLHRVSELLLESRIEGRVQVVIGIFSVSRLALMKVVVAWIECLDVLEGLEVGDAPVEH